MSNEHYLFIVEISANFKLWFAVSFCAACKFKKKRTIRQNWIVFCRAKENYFVLIRIFSVRENVEKVPTRNFFSRD